MSKQLALDINERKLKLEAYSLSKIKAIFRNIAIDSENLYKHDINFSSEELAKNYYSEFLSEIRDIMRKTAKEFGFDIRDELEAKHDIFFDSEFKKEFVFLDTKKVVSINDTNVDKYLDKINSDFVRAVTFFVANNSENQTKYITDTNAKEIELAIRQEEERFRQFIQDQQSAITNLTLQEQSLGLRLQIESANRQLAQTLANRNEIIAKNIKANLLYRSQARSELISAQTVGLTESWSRQKEAELIDGANLATNAGKEVKLTKTWIAILDGKTRPEHAAADFQEVWVNDYFIVGGERLKYPRDENGSAANVINCRCIIDNQVHTI